MTPGARGPVDGRMLLALTTDSPRQVAQGAEIGPHGRVGRTGERVPREEDVLARGHALPGISPGGLQRSARSPHGGSVAPHGARFATPLCHPDARNSPPRRARKDTNDPICPPGGRVSSPLHVRLRTRTTPMSTPRLSASQAECRGPWPAPTELARARGFARRPGPRTAPRLSRVPAW